MHSSSVRTLKLKLAAEQLSTGKCWIPTKKDTLRPKAKEKPQQDGRRVEITFSIKPHTYQRRSEGPNKILCAPGEPTETETDLPLRVWVSPVEVQVSSLYTQITWTTACLNQWNYEPCHLGAPRMDRSWWEFWQSVVHRRRELQTTSEFLPWEPHEQYEKAKR